MKSIFSILVITIASTVISCKKENAASAPIITISKPTEGQVLDVDVLGDNTSVGMSISDDNLKLYSVLIAKANGSDTLFYIPETANTSKSISINETIQLRENNGYYTVFIYAVDQNNNVTTKSVNFQIFER